MKGPARPLWFGILLLVIGTQTSAQFPPAPGTGPGLAETIEAIDSARPWYTQVTKDQWGAFMAVFLGWIVDAFDFIAYKLA